jgi:hypothetical protein
MVKNMFDESEVNRRRHSTRRPLCDFVLVALVFAFACSALPLCAAGEHPLVPYLKLARESRDAAAQLNDYQADFEKQELIAGRLTHHQMLIKQRNQPFSVYLRFSNPNPGREVLYVDGKNKGKLIAHEGKGLKAWAGSMWLAPKCPQAMIDNRYPITQIGMLRMIETVIHQWEEETNFGETDVKYYPDSKLNGTECSIIESSHPRPRRQFKFHMTRLFIDKKTKLPFAVQQWGFPPAGDAPSLEEQYIYSDIKPNIRLTDADFDSKNRNYKF